MQIKTTILVILIFLIACSPKKTKSVESIDNESLNQSIDKDYYLINDEGIFVEKFDSTNISDNRYTDNNTIYTEGAKFVFDYYYQDRSGNNYKFEQDDSVLKNDPSNRGKAWKFISVDNLSKISVNSVELEVKWGLEPFKERNPDYNQTIIQYKYPQLDSTVNFSSKTGVIENEKNIWIHPPRSLFFRILEINPFPFIQKPYEIGNKWNWSLMIGSFWGDERWKTWEGSIENNYEYEIVNKKKIETKMGNLECIVINSTATSKIGKTYLKSYFNEDYGFVKLDYTNIDSTKTIMELKAISI